MAGDALQLKDIRCFLAVADATAMRRAATIMGSRQSVVSRRIRTIEGALRVSLFETASGRSPSNGGHRIGSGRGGERFGDFRLRAHPRRRVHSRGRDRQPSVGQYPPTSLAWAKRFLGPVSAEAGPRQAKLTLAETKFGEALSFVALKKVPGGAALSVPRGVSA